MLKRTNKLKVGNPLYSDTQMGPLIARRAVEKNTQIYRNRKKENAKLLTGGEPLKGKGFFYKPTIFTNVKPTMRIAQEEIFGPVLSLIKAQNFDDAIQICNGVEYGLSASMYT